MPAAAAAAAATVVKGGDWRLRLTEGFDGGNKRVISSPIENEVLKKKVDIDSVI